MKQFFEKYFGKFWLVVVYLFLYLLLFFMIVFSFNSIWQDVNFIGFLLCWYEVFMCDSKIVEGFWLLVKVVVVMGVFLVVFGIFVVFVLVCYCCFFGCMVFLGMVNVLLVMFEVVIGLLLLLLMVGVQNVFGWFECGMLIIIFGYILLGMVYGMVVIQSWLMEMNCSIEEVVMDLGVWLFQVFFLIILFNIFQGILVVFLLLFMFLFDDVVIFEFFFGLGVNMLL